MFSYPSFPPLASPAVSGWPADGPAAGIVAVRVADLRSPVRGRKARGGGRTALVATGAGKIADGELVVFLKPVAVAPAVVGRDGRVQATGHPAELLKTLAAQTTTPDDC